VPDFKEEHGTRQAAQAEATAFTEKRVLDAAAETFARRGLAGTRVREIADAAGVNVATLYNYYPSKDAVHACAKTRFTIEKTRIMKSWGLYCPSPFFT
jgi:AcrR family transcriptional regulator